MKLEFIPVDAIPPGAFRRNKGAYADAIKRFAWGTDDIVSIDAKDNREAKNMQVGLKRAIDRMADQFPDFTIHVIKRAHPPKVYLSREGWA